MNSGKFHALLAILVPPVIQLVMADRKISNIEATKMFYNSQLYEKLENEATKLWHLSAETLFELFNEGVMTGAINYPEES
jgi:hypothetical protein